MIMNECGNIEKNNQNEDDKQSVKWFEKMISMEDKVEPHAHIFSSWRRGWNSEVEKKNLKLHLRKNLHNQRKPWASIQNL